MRDVDQAHIRVHGIKCSCITACTLYASQCWFIMLSWSKQLNCFCSLLLCKSSQCCYIMTVKTLACRQFCLLGLCLGCMGLAWATFLHRIVLNIIKYIETPQNLMSCQALYIYPPAGHSKCLAKQ